VVLGQKLGRAPALLLQPLVTRFDPIRDLVDGAYLSSNLIQHAVSVEAVQARASFMKAFAKANG
jgi:hypothetical protein